MWDEFGPQLARIVLAYATQMIVDPRVGVDRNALVLSLLDDVSGAALHGSGLTEDCQHEIGMGHHLDVSVEDLIAATGLGSEPLDRPIEHLARQRERELDWPRAGADPMPQEQDRVERQQGRKQGQRHVPIQLMAGGYANSGSMSISTRASLGRTITLNWSVVRNHESLIPVAA